MECTVTSVIAVATTREKLGEASQLLQIPYRKQGYDECQGGCFMFSTSSTPDALNSWKQIAVYLDRGVRTVQRWHTELRLPVHKIRATEHSPVFAFKSELDYWLRQRAHADTVAESSSTAIVEAWHLLPRTLGLTGAQRMKFDRVTEHFDRSKGLLNQRSILHRARR